MEVKFEQYMRALYLRGFNFVNGKNAQRIYVCASCNNYSRIVPICLDKIVVKTTLTVDARIPISGENKIFHIPTTHFDYSSSFSRC